MVIWLQDAFLQDIDWAPSNVRKRDPDVVRYNRFDSSEQAKKLCLFSTYIDLES